MRDKPLIIITGGTSGVGFELAKYFVRDYNLALVFRQNALRAKNALDYLSKESSSTTKIFQQEIIDDETAMSAYTEIKNAYQSPVYALINCAGDTQMELFLNVDYSFIHKMFSSHVFGVVCLSRIVLEDMYMNKRGKIINFSSIAVKMNQPGLSVYGAAKNAIEGFTLAISKETYHKNIAVNCVRLGVVKLPGENLDHVNMIQPQRICEKIEELLNDEPATITGNIFSLEN